MPEKSYFLIMGDADVDRLLAGYRVDKTYRHWYVAGPDVGMIYNVQRKSTTHDEADVIVKVVAHRREQIGKGQKRPQFNHVFTFELVSK